MSEHTQVRVLIVDDHALLREGISAVINNQSDMHMVAEASNATEAIEQFRKHRPDVTLMDLRLPNSSGIDAMIAIRTEFPEARIIILTTFEGDVEIQRALEAGARAYILKRMPPQGYCRSDPPGARGKEADSAGDRDASRRAFKR